MEDIRARYRNGVKTNGALTCPQCGAPITDEKCEYCGECPLWLGDEEASDNERMAFQQGRKYERKIIIEELLSETEDWKDNYGSFLDFQRVLRNKLKEAEEEKNG